jgi:hypothetical protein
MTEIRIGTSGRSCIVELNLCLSPDYGKQKLYVNGIPVKGEIYCYSETLFWLHPKLGVFELKRGKNILGIQTLEPNPDAKPGNLFGLDYIFLIKQKSS